MGRPRKYLKGPRLMLQGVLSRILEGEYIMFNDKPIHPGWARGWSISTIQSLCAAQQLFAAYRNPAHKDWQG